MEINNKNTICRLVNKNNGTEEIYRGATYTKLNGMYGYICVEGFKVLFFWCYNDKVCMDELDYFNVIYENDER